MNVLQELYTLCGRTMGMTTTAYTPGEWKKKAEIPGEWKEKNEVCEKTCFQCNESIVSFSMNRRMGMITTIYIYITLYITFTCTPGE